ncbi:adenosylcobinamide-phosphate synthase CbiB [Cereibacter sp. SYSU M97828]|nr:adenosylcobinamide-phosphate synthase CbiB [Cereibacter flavus]
MFLTAMGIALAIEAAFGWPSRLHARIGHPVTWIGAMIAWSEARLNKGGARARIIGGAITAVGVLAVTVGIAASIRHALPGGWWGTLLTGLLCWPLVAARSLHDHVAAVARPLAAGDVDGARRAVAMIVGRDPALLDTAGIARAGMESLAENASDGVIAPLFWGAIFGLPGIAGYKAVNTMDSMIGHRITRYLHFGRVAARLDDAANLVPARLTALLLTVAARRNVLRGVIADAPRHRSPNAGWPEAAMAHALNVRLSGPRTYAGHVAPEPWLNQGASDPGAKDMEGGLRLFRRAMMLAGAILFLGGWV